VINFEDCILPIKVQPEPVSAGGTPVRSEMPHTVDGVVARI